MTNNNNNQHVDDDINNEDDTNKQQSRFSKYFSGDNFPKHIMGPSFLNKEMPLSMFFVTAGCLAAVGFGTGILLGLRKTGGVRQTIRSAPPGVVGAAVKALIGGTAICAAMTTTLVYILKSAYNIETVKDFGDMMRGRNKQSNLILVEQQQQQQEEQQDLSQFTEQDLATHRDNLQALKALKYIPFNDEDLKEISKNTTTTTTTTTNNNNNNNIPTDSKK